MFMLSSVSAMTAYQQVSVTVVSGFLNVYSPIDKVYQENQILLSLNITTPFEVNSVWFVEGKEIKTLCSKCKSYSKETYFSDGKHNIQIRARLSNGDTLEQNVSFQVNSGSPIYIQNSAGLKKTNAKDIVDYLFHYNFTLELKNEMAPEDSCSVRAKNGSAIVDGVEFGNNNKLNFYAIQSLPQGQVELSMQSKRKSVSYKFKVKEILENSDNLLRISLIDKKNNEALLEFDKLTNKTSVHGDSFSVEGMQAYFVSGCSATKDSFWLLKKEGRRINRNIDEVRDLISSNPIFTSRFESLKFLFTSNWRIRQILGWY